MLTVRRLYVAALIAIAVIGLSACGGGSDDPNNEASATPGAEGTPAATESVQATPANSPADAGGDDTDGPCSLLTPEEGDQLLGIAATSVEETVTGPFVACQWINDSSLPIQLLQIGTFDFDVDSDFFRETAGANGSDDLEEIDGFGDEALWDGSQLFIRRGELMISILPSRDGGRDQAVAAAELVLPRFD